MKLRNKLLPLASIAALSSAIVPLSMITSCSKQSGITEYDITKGAHYHQEYYKGEKALNQNQATKAFVDAVTANPEIFKQDLLSAYYEFYDYDVNYQLIDKYEQKYYVDYEHQVKFVSTIVSAKVGLSNPVFDYVTVRFPGEPSLTYPVISFNMTYDVKFQTRSTTPWLDRDVVVNTTYSGANSYKNIPYYAYATVDDSFIRDMDHKKNWSVGVLDAYHNKYLLNAFRTWEIKNSYKTTIETSYTGPDGVTTTETSVDENSAKYDSLKQLEKLTVEQISNFISFDFASSYLEGVKVIPQVVTDSLKGKITYTTSDYLPDIVELTGLYIPLTADLKDKIAHMEEGDDINDYLAVFFDNPKKEPTAHYLKSSDRQYKIRLLDFEDDGIQISKEPEQIAGGVWGLPVTLTYRWTDDKKPILSDEPESFDFSLPVSSPIWIGLVQDWQNPESEVDFYSSTLYYNDSVLPVKWEGRP